MSDTVPPAVVVAGVCGRGHVDGREQTRKVATGVIQP